MRATFNLVQSARHQHCKYDGNENKRGHISHQMTALGRIAEDLNAYDRASPIRGDPRCPRPPPMGLRKGKATLIACLRRARLPPSIRQMKPTGRRPEHRA